MCFAQASRVELRAALRDIVALEKHARRQDKRIQYLDAQLQLREKLAQASEGAHSSLHQCFVFAILKKKPF